jgi:hypothetical protein
VVSVAVDDYVAMKNATVEGTLLRRLSGRDRWETFTRDVASRFRDVYGATVSYVRDFLVSAATKSH